MPKEFYVVTLVFPDSKKQYFVKTYFKPSKEPLGLSEPMGIFSYNSKDARLFEDKGQAEWAASYFDGAKIERVIKMSKLERKFYVLVNRAFIWCIETKDGKIHKFKSRKRAINFLCKADKRGMLK